MYNSLLKNILSEANIRPEPVEVYGSNIGKYDDSKIGYNSVLKAYFIVFAVEQDNNEGFVAVSISRKDGTISYTYSDNAYIGRMLHMPAMKRKKNIMSAVEYLPQILFAMQLILKKYNMMVPQLRIVSISTLQQRHNKFLIKSSAFKMMAKKYRFKDVVQSKEKVNGKDVVVYTLSSEKKQPKK